MGKLIDLSDDEIETIRIHMNAFKEQLCNQGRWSEAEEYQQIVFKLLDAAPAVYGRWIEKDDPYSFFDTIPVCSVCGCTTKMRQKTRFCPNCGAKMAERKG